MAGRIFTIKEVSHICSVDFTTALKWVDKGDLPIYRTARGARRVLREDLITFLNRKALPIPLQFQKRGKRVLSVDDDPTILHGMTRLINRMDHQLVMETATDGIEATKKIPQFKPNLVILDLMLPRLDGFRVCKEIRKNKMYEDVKILAFSGLPFDDTEKRIRDCGANDYIGKPFELENLVTKITQLLEPS